MKDGDFKEYGEQPSQGKINKEKLDNIMQNPYEIFICIINIVNHIETYN